MSEVIFMKNSKRLLLTFRIIRFLFSYLGNKRIIFSNFGPILYTE